MQHNIWAHCCQQQQHLAHAVDRSQHRTLSDVGKCCSCWLLLLLCCFNAVVLIYMHAPMQAAAAQVPSAACQVDMPLLPQYSSQHGTAACTSLLLLLHGIFQSYFDAVCAQLLRGGAEPRPATALLTRLPGQQPPHRAQTFAAVETVALKPVCSDKGLRGRATPRNAHWPLSDMERRYSTGAIYLCGRPGLRWPAQTAQTMPVMPAQ